MQILNFDYKLKPLQNLKFESKLFAIKMPILNLVLLIAENALIDASTNNDDKYFLKAIFRQLKEKKAQFSSNMKVGKYHCEDDEEERGRNPKNCLITFQDYLKLECVFVDRKELTNR